MRGNDKGNFACNRFFYDGQSPCIVPEKEVSNKQDDTNNFKKEEIGSFYGTKYYKISGEETIDICTRTFDMARKCCKYRSKHLVCLEKINTGNVKNDITNRNFREYIYGGKEYVSGIPEKRWFKLQS